MQILSIVDILCFPWKYWVIIQWSCSPGIEILSMHTIKHYYNFKRIPWLELQMTHQSMSLVWRQCQRPPCVLVQWTEDTQLTPVWVMKSHFHCYYVDFRVPGLGVDHLPAHGLLVVPQLHGVAAVSGGPAHRASHYFRYMMCRHADLYSTLYWLLIQLPNLRLHTCTPQGNLEKLGAQADWRQWWQGLRW